MFLQAIEPTDTVSDPLQRQQVRLLNSLIVVFVPIAILTGIVQMFVARIIYFRTSEESVIIVAIAIIGLLMAYGVGRYVGYRWAIGVVILAGYLIIIFNALFYNPNFVDILYILLLSVVASTMINLRLLVALAGLEILTAGFVFYIMRVDGTASLKLMSFIMVANILILIMTYYRDRLEKDRRQKLSESEHFLRLITSQLPVTVWTTDNKLSKQATLGRIQTDKNILTIPDRQSINAYQVALQGESSHFEHQQGNRVYNYHIEPMRDEAGQIVGTLGVATDITDQKQAQQQAQQLKLEQDRVNMLSQFIEHSSHDLRTPISNINTYLYLLSHHVQSEKEQHYIDIIRQQSERLHNLIDNMFALHRLELEDDYKLVPTLLNSLLNELHVICKPRVDKANIHCEFDIPDTNIVLNITAQHIHTALTKIVDNAIQYTPEDGVIRLSYMYNDDCVVISIADTGIGIPPEQLPHIFDMFYRGDESRSPLTGDNGLGLTIAERIIRTHQGKIEVESVVDEGTTFHITLPILKT